MALFGNRHIPFASAGEDAAKCSITFGSPSKTFNIAGIVSSYAIVPDKSLRDKFFGYLRANEYNDAPIFSPIATIAAFREGEQWRRAMIEYVEGNIETVISFCKDKMPGIKPLRPQASFLVWLDCRGLYMDHDRLQDFFVNHARLALNDGEMFDTAGDPNAPLHNAHSAGRGFMRLNVGCPRAVLEHAMAQLAEACSQLPLPR